MQKNSFNKKFLFQLKFSTNFKLICAFIKKSTVVTSIFTFTNEVDWNAHFNDNER